MTPAIVSMSGVSFVFATPLHRPLQDLPRGLGVLLLDAIELADSRLRLLAVGHEAVAGFQRENHVRRKSTRPVSNGEERRRRRTSSQ